MKNHHRISKVFQLSYHPLMIEKEVLAIEAKK